MNPSFLFFFIIPVGLCILGHFEAFSWGPSFFSQDQTLKHFCVHMYRWEVKAARRGRGVGGGAGKLTMIVDNCVQSSRRSIASNGLLVLYCYVATALLRYIGSVHTPHAHGIHKQYYAHLCTLVQIGLKVWSLDSSRLVFQGSAWDHSKIEFNHRSIGTLSHILITYQTYLNIYSIFIIYTIIYIVHFKV